MLTVTKLILDMNGAVMKGLDFMNLLNLLNNY